MKLKHLGNIYEIHIDSFLRLSELEEYGVDNIIELPNVEGLDEAVCLINYLCGIELRKRQKVDRDHYLLEKGSEILKEVKNDVNMCAIKDILEAVYQKGKNDN